MEELIANIVNIILNNIGIYLIVGIMTSVLVEAVNGLTQARSNLLHGLLKTMLSGLKSERMNVLFDHPFVSPLGLRSEGRYPRPRSAYIPPALFARAIGDVVLDQNSALRFQDFDEGRLKSLFVDILARTKGDREAFYSEIISWFTNAMSQGTAVFKRRCQLICFLIGMAIAILFNIQMTPLSFTTPEHAKVENSASGGVEQDGKSSYAFLITAMMNGHITLSQFLTYNLGALITAIACFLLSPLWFDIMNNFANLRSDGMRPDDQPSLPTPSP